MYDSLRWRIPLILALLAASVAMLLYGKLHLGFDLKGGVELRYRLEGVLSPEQMKGLTAAQIAAAKKDIDVKTKDTIKVVTKRLDPAGNKQLDIRSSGPGEIIIRLPGLTPEEVKSIKRRAEQMGKLEFQMVVPKDEYDKMPEDERKEKDIRLMRMKLPKKRPDDPDVYDKLYVQTRDKFKITGRMLESVNPAMDEIGAQAVGFRFDNKGAKRFAEMTSVLAGKGRIAIILNGQLYSAPRVEERIGRSGIIRGEFTQAEVDDLVAVLKAGSLKAALILQMERSVGPDLGTDSRDRGYFAVKLAFGLVVAFMLVYYLLSGAIADLALLLNLVFLLAAMMLTEAVLTLPGIAGVILTVGMAVDANVLIYERVREELASGQALRFAVRNGYARAFTAIFDANLTTLITALILYRLGTGAVRGFAVTLSIGIVVGMFTALFVTRVIFDILLAKGWLKERLPMMRLLKQPKIAFVRWAPVCIVLSFVLIVSGIVTFVYRGHDNYGIDFASGTAMHLQLKGVGVRTSDVTTTAAGDASRFTVRFFEQGTGGAQGTPVRVPLALVEEGLSRLKRIDASLDLAGVTVVAGKDAGDISEVELNVAEPGGTTAAGMALVKLIGQKGPSVFRTRMDIKDLRRMVAEAGYPGADVQTAFNDENVVGLRESDQFIIRVRSESDNETQAQREAVPTNIEQAFVELVDHRGVDAEVVVTPIKSGDITAGSQVELSFVQFVPADNVTEPVGLRRPHIERSIAAAGLPDVTIQWPAEEQKYYDDITFNTSSTDKDGIVKTLSAKNAFTFPDAFTGYYFVGPGQARETVLGAWLAAGLSLIAIVIYVWLRFGALKYGLAAVVALAHDVLFALGALAAAAWLAETPMGELLGIGDVRLSLPIVAGILTIIGYSLNDTIVVFDRVRENVRRRIRELRGKRSKEDALTPALIDQSINQTLSRTILTSFTTLVVCVTLYVAGGMTLHGLALCLIIGVVVGTYSSIFIASPILVLAHAWELRRARASGALTTEEEEVARERGNADRP